ncbi:multicopper oxidase family protein [Pseudomonas sp. GOM6]|uniref:multicopper oxidase family protein n=1 Tax=Pseudomonas sp. GOM6 TaxID=3036944 RepID=UPI002409CA2B|nr:multicopper oxidase family protein [Pseudomonas sp. GOM6]MDG1581520.1 multicopper oxidase family protein [Pseudomonas sp. GOM6]
MTFTRRQILVGLGALGVAGLGAGGVRYWLGRPADVTTHDYELIAAPLDMELVPGHKTPAWAFGGQAPGLELRVRQGDSLRVRFINQLEVETTIHWHGIRLPLEMDGVPYVSQAPVKPGEYFDYQFLCHDAGSFWYHPHTASSEQLGRGLVGPLIVEEREPTGFFHERTLSLKTWHVDEQGAFTAFSVPRLAAREGTRGRLSTINGQHLPVLDLPAGQVVRLRLLNLDNTISYRLNLKGAGEARIYALDGHPVAPRALGKEYLLGAGMRIDLAVKVPAAGQEISLRNGPLRLATLRSVASAEAPGDWPSALPANPVAEPDLTSAETLRFNFEWSAVLASPQQQGPASYWQINGQAWDINDKRCAERPIATLQKDRSYIFELRNMAQYLHPIHLHGMTFRVLDSDRKRITPYYTDTYLLGKNETARIAFVADNPGVWMFHCHVIDHMETGLMAAIAVV